ncbi:MAG: hypothetical protein U9R08_00520 [Nanoarchaeota archaeon]|nr:hypothetical protein [Nanoarchaeota archaeon]
MVRGIPTIVKVFSVLFYIEAVLSFLLAIAAFIGGSLLNALGQSFLSMFSGIAVGLGVGLLIWAVLSFFIGRGLWKGQNWARILASIFAILGFLMSILSLMGGAIVSGILSLLITGLIAYYLLFNKDVKRAFS